MNQLDCVTSVCTLRDLNAWLLVSKQIPTKIASKRYRVIVPDDQVRAFQERTPAKIEVHPESIYISDLYKTIKTKVPTTNQHRTGWYLQQFIKLASLIDGDNGENHLIWDADTVPLKNLDFVDHDGRLAFYKSNERNPDYFPPIERLLGINNSLPFSFIAQCLACKTEWAKEMAAAIEISASKPWALAILDAVDFRKTSGFSEYETLGSFMMANHSNGIRLTDGRWFRYGGSLLGDPANMNRQPYKWFLDRYDFISLESWDTGVRLPRAANFLNALRKELLTKGRL